MTNTGDTKESKKYGCVCTCCHIDNLPRYKCVIFLTKNYNFDIPAVANALAKRHREIRQKRIHMQTMSSTIERWQIQQ